MGPIGETDTLWCGPRNRDRNTVLALGPVRETSTLQNTSTADINLLLVVSQKFHQQIKSWRLAIQTVLVGLLVEAQHFFSDLKRTQLFIKLVTSYKRPRKNCLIHIVSPKKSPDRLC